MLEVTNLVKKFQSGDTTVTATNDVSLSVPDGQFVSVVGRSGSGKSTLLSLLGALDKPTSYVSQALNTTFHAPAPA